MFNDSLVLEKEEIVNPFDINKSLTFNKVNNDLLIESYYFCEKQSSQIKRNNTHSV